MAAETICSWGVVGDHGCCHVPSVASNVAYWGLVFEYGHAWAHRAILRYGNFQTDIVLCHLFHCEARAMAVSKSV